MSSYGASQGHCQNTSHFFRRRCLSPSTAESEQSAEGWSETVRQRNYQVKSFTYWWIGIIWAFHRTIVLCRFKCPPMDDIIHVNEVYVEEHQHGSTRWFTPWQGGLAFIATSIQQEHVQGGKGHAAQDSRCLGKKATILPSIFILSMAKPAPPTRIGALRMSITMLSRTTGRKGCHMPTLLR